MKMSQRSAIRVLLQALAVFGVSLAFDASSAEAQWIDEIGRCEYRSGFLAFADTVWPNEVCGYVSGKNPNWALLPGRNWNDKADAFWNRGTTHNACIYTLTGYNGSARLIRRGDYVIDVPAWKNVVSSNHWTTTSTCPRP